MDRAKYLELLEEARDQVLLRPSKEGGRKKRCRPHPTPREPILDTIIRKRKGAIEDKLARNIALLTNRKTQKTGPDYLLAQLQQSRR